MENLGLFIVILIGLIWLVGVGCTIYSFFEKPIPNFVIKKPVVSTNSNYENLGFVNDEEENASVIIID